ncbi:MAG: hypothetical protein V9G24_07020 [Rhodoblastus sp.]
MGAVDDHAEIVHARDDLPAEIAQALRARLVGGAVAPVERGIVAERHETHAEIVVGVERVEPVLDRRAVLDGDETRDLLSGGARASRRWRAAPAGMRPDAVRSCAG